MSENNITFKINQIIEIIDNGQTFNANIQDINKEYIMINMPVSDNKYYIMHRGSIIEFYVTTNRDISKFRSEVLGKKIENNIQLVILSSPEFIERVQRREYFRLPVSLAVKIYMFPDDREYTSIHDVPEESFRKLKNGIIVDISGGGLKIAVKEKMIKGHYAVISMQIPDELILLSKIVWVEKDQENRNYKVALKYENISERERDKIIKFIFAKMRSQSKLLK